MFKKFVCAVMLFSLCAISGCGEKTYTVQGTVTFKDGSPVTQGAVNFDSGTFSFVGHLDAQGKYTPGLGKSKGIPEGTYKVWLVGTEAVTNTEGSNGLLVAGKPVPTVAAKYCSEKTSDLVLEVKPGSPLQLDIVVDKP